MAGPLAVLFITGGLAFSHGGYGPSAISWTSALALSASSVLVVLCRTRLSTPQALYLGFAVGAALWTGASWVGWSESPAASAAETQRWLMYLGCASLIVLLLRWTSPRAMSVGLLLASVVIAGCSLQARLFPSGASVGTPAGGGRLGGLLGYPNALGIVCAIGLLLALDVVGNSSRAARALGGVAVPILALAFTLTYSRGAWIALIAGGVVAVATSRSRRTFVTSRLAFIAFGSLTVVLALNAPAVDQWVNPAAAAPQAHRVAAVTFALAVGSASVAALRLSSFRRAALAAVAVILVVAATVSFSSPVTATGGSAPSGARSSNDGRLVELQGNRTAYWAVAARDFLAHPLLGSGAGSYAAEWTKHRRVDEYVKNAHNLYVETLAEVGVIGFVLTVGFLLLPLVAIFRRRQRAVAPALVGAYVAFLVHLSVDWDWQIAAVGLFGVFVGATLLASPLEDPVGPAPRSLRMAEMAAVAALLAACGFAYVTVLGNSAEAKAVAAARAGDWDAAGAAAARAHQWLPWAGEPLYIEAGSALARGDRARAVRLYGAAARKDRTNWLLWYWYGTYAAGTTKDAALARAALLNPRGVGARR